MPTNNKGLEQPANGSNVDTWDVPVNGNFGIIDEALGGISTLTQTTGTHTLAIGVYRTLILQSTVTLTGNVRYNIPSGVGGQWIVRNATSGNFTFTIGTTAGGGTTVVIPQGQVELIYSDGTNIRLARTTGERFPVGAIVMWSGTIATIPTGWLLCNGQPGTPDLRDKFIIGAAQDDAGVAKTNITGSLTQTGGSKDAIVVEHTHTATIASAGLHSHEYFPFGTGIGTAFGTAETFQESQPARLTASAGAHVHTATIDSSGTSGTNGRLPPYYALAYIIRTAY